MKAQSSYSPSWGLNFTGSFLTGTGQPNPQPTPILDAWVLKVGTL